MGMPFTTRNLPCARRETTNQTWERISEVIGGASFYCNTLHWIRSGRSMALAFGATRYYYTTDTYKTLRNSKESVLSLDTDEAFLSSFGMHLLSIFALQFRTSIFNNLQQ